MTAACQPDRRVDDELYYMYIIIIAERNEIKLSTKTPQVHGTFLSCSQQLIIPLTLFITPSLTIPSLQAERHDSAPISVVNKPKFSPNPNHNPSPKLDPYPTILI